jgi:hypothetical protein
MDIRDAKPETPLVKNLVHQCSSDLESRPGLEIPDGIKPTILYCTNRNVDKENYENLAKLQTQGKIFHAKDDVYVDASVGSGSSHSVIEQNLKRNGFFSSDCSATKQVHLKIGAQVMLLQNLGELKI